MSLQPLLLKHLASPKPTMIALERIATTVMIVTVLVPVIDAAVMNTAGTAVVTEMPMAMTIWRDLTATMAVLTEAIEAERGPGAEAVRVTDVVLVAIAMATATAPAATSTVALDGLALARVHPVMTDTTAPRAAIVMMTDALAVAVTVAATVLAGVPPNPLNSMKMNETSEPSSCNSLLPV